MIISWIKTLFKKKNLDYTTTSDISIIDTSFIRVPKLSELSSEDRQLVKQYIQELKYDDYESVLKYSDELLNKSNNEIEFFMVNLGEIIKDISSVINEVNQENYFKLLLSKEEIKQSVDEFHKIINEGQGEIELSNICMYISITAERQRKKTGLWRGLRKRKDS